MTNIFESISTTILDIMSAESDGKGTYDDGLNTPSEISVVLDKDVELIQDDRYSYQEDGGSIYENTMSIPSMTTKIGAKITLDGRDWKIGRTLSDDGAIKVVIVE